MLTPFTYCHSAILLSSVGVTSHPQQAKVSVITCFLPSCWDTLATCLGVSSEEISLPSQSAILSAFINDVDPEMMYAQLVYGYAKEGDLVIGLSTSGNSKNVVNAMEVAKAVGAKTLSMTGQRESKLSAISDVTVRVPETETYKIQELHLPVYHYLCAGVEKHFFG